MPKNTLLPLLLLLLSITISQAQSWQIGGSYDVGIGKMKDNFPVPNEKDHFSPLSENIGIFVARDFDGKSSISLGLQGVVIKGLITRDYEEISFGIDTATVTVPNLLRYRSRTRLYYIGIPLSYRFQVGKVGMRAGGRALFFMGGVNRTIMKTEINGEIGESTGTSIYTRGGIEMISKLDAGPSIGMDYSINKHLRLRADYYHGFVNLVTLQPLPSDIERYNRQLTIGLDFFFILKRE